MKKKTETGDTEVLLAKIVASMQEKKARNIVSMDLRNVNSAVTSYFVICHAPSKTQVDAIYDYIVEMVRKDCDEKPFNREGYENSEWILIDYVDVVVHVFQEDIRSFYKIEDLWADAALKTYKSDE